MKKILSIKTIYWTNLCCFTKTRTSSIKTKHRRARMLGTDERIALLFSLFSLFFSQTLKQCLKNPNFAESIFSHWLHPSAPCRALGSCLLCLMGNLPLLLQYKMVCNLTQIVHVMVLKALLLSERTGLRGICPSRLYAFQPSISVNSTSHCTNYKVLSYKMTGYTYTVRSGAV